MKSMKAEEPKWQVALTPNYFIHVKVPPNWFQRKMQEIVFGFKWSIR